MDPVLGKSFMFHTLSTVYIPGIGHWQADVVRQKCLDPMEWPLHSELFQDLCNRWEMLDANVLAFKLNSKQDRFISIQVFSSGSSRYSCGSLE